MGLSGGFLGNRTVTTERRLGLPSSGHPLFLRHVVPAVTSRASHRRRESERPTSISGDDRNLLVDVGQTRRTTRLENPHGDFEQGAIPGRPR
jgi:hypothetical protein